jgi:transposase
MRTATTRRLESTPLPPVLYMALELAEGKWKLGFTVAFGQRPRLREILARDTAALVREIEAALRRFRLDATTPVLSCYEAGREGFWLHRFLEHAGVTNLVVDAGSMEMVPGRRRRKTDRLDTGKLLECLIRHRESRGCGRKVWSVVRVPTPEAEDARQLNRELMSLRHDRTRLTNRMHGLLAGQGVRLELGSDFPEQLDAVALWDGCPLPPRLHARLLREWARLGVLCRQIRGLEQERRQLLRTSEDESVERVRKLLALRAIGINSAWLFVMEFFGWREFRNRRQVGALAGLVASPFSSGDTERELGISKAGNRHIRALAIEIAWCWLRFQPQSELAQWYERRFAHGSRRIRKIGIVAVARRLLVELWRYLETGRPPAGALLKV